MTNDLAPTVAFGVGGALLAFECLVALVSLVQARSGRRDRRAGLATGSLTPLVSLTPRMAIRAHVLAQRPVVNATRRQYPTLRSPRHGRDLRRRFREAIGRHHRKSVGARTRVQLWQKCGSADQHAAQG